jgi:hypothetical protein
MSVFQNLTALALRHLAEAAGAKEGVDAVARFLGRHFSDHSQRLTNAIRSATDRSWKALEVALAGESLKDRLARTEDRELRKHVGGFLDAFADREAGHDPAFRQRCLDELRAARKSGKLGGGLDPEALSRQVGELARYTDPQALLRAELALLNGVAEELSVEYPTLAFLLETEPEPGRSLLVIAARYFFRRAVEEDRELFQGLAFAKLEGLETSQERGFAALDALLKQQRQRLEAALVEVQTIVAETHGAVLDVRRQMDGN